MCGIGETDEEEAEDNDEADDAEQEQDEDQEQDAENGNGGSGQESDDGQAVRYLENLYDICAWNVAPCACLNCLEFFSSSESRR